MFYALSWLAVFALLAIWSMVVWALHAMTTWALSSAGVLTGAASDATSVALPGWLSPWIPAELIDDVTHFAKGLVPLLESLIQAAPSLAGGLSIAAWVIWAIGGLILLVLGVAVHVLGGAMWRQRGVVSGPDTPPRLAKS